MIFLGDPDFKEYVISNPEVVEVDRSEDLNEAYIVIGSDGLWDKISPLEVGDFVGDFIAKNGKKITCLYSIRALVLFNSLPSSLLRGSKGSSVTCKSGQVEWLTR